MFKFVQYISCNIKRVVQLTNKEPDALWLTVTLAF